MTTFSESPFSIHNSGVKERFTKWKLQLSDITMDESKFAYAAYLKKVTETMDTAYMVVAMIPYNRLWYWFGTQIDAVGTCSFVLGL